jgi:hypothetical protein
VDDPRDVRRKDEPLKHAEVDFQKVVHQKEENR